MFTLKDHARRNARLAALGAAATVGMMAGATQAVTLQWDPSGAGTFAAPVGGAGNFNNTDSTFVDAGDNQVPAGTADDVIFSGAGAAVNVNGTTLLAPSGGNPQTGTQVGNLTLSPTSNSYTFSGTAPIILGAFSATLSQTSGNNTISAPVALFGNSSAAQNVIDTAAGTNLTIANLTYAGYGWGGLSKTGDGRVTFTSILNRSGSLSASQGLNILGGTVMVNTPAQANDGIGPGATLGGGGFKVQTGATLGGDGGLRLPDTSTSNILSGGHLAPGANPVGSNFGAAGTFTLRGGQSSAPAISDVTFDTGSNFDIDLLSLASYDSIALTKGGYGRMNFIVSDSTVVNINNGVGALTPGTYNIVTMLEQQNVLTGDQAALNIDVNGAGFVIGNAPAGYSYQFQNVLGNTGFYNGEIVGINLVVTAVPEPASIGVLGIGTGLMLLRSRRRKG